jgi:hypothetical protein
MERKVDDPRFGMNHPDATTRASSYEKALERVNDDDDDDNDATTDRLRRRGSRAPRKPH